MTLREACELLRRRPMMQRGGVIPWWCIHEDRRATRYYGEAERRIINWCRAHWNLRKHRRMGFTAATFRGRWMAFQFH